MKLNKVLALALSGVMAVSMLAGCSNNTTDDKGEQAPATGIVAAVNDGQKASNAVKVTFAADATLDAQLSKAVAAAGNKASAANVENYLKTVMGDTSIISLSDGQVGGLFLDETNLNADKVTSKKVVGVEVIKATDNFTEAAALNQIATEVNKITEDLKKLSKEPTNVNQQYAAYEYAGTVSMIETTALDGTTAYYAAIVITNTCTLKTVTV